MTLDDCFQEIVVPDIHNDWHFYKRLARVIDDDTDRVFLVGDLRDEIDWNNIKEFVPEDSEAIIQVFKDSEKVYLSMIREKFGSEQRFIDALQAGEASPGDLQIYQDLMVALQEAQGIDDKVFLNESMVDYSIHEDHIKALKEANPNANFFGVPGNHDSAFIRGIKSVDWLVYTQTLQDEGIVGALACRENFGEMNPRWNGPEYKYAPLGKEGDDDYTDLDKSRLYQEWKGFPVDLMVSHVGGHWGKARGPKKAGLGITKLGEEQGFVCYAGHDHRGHIYRDPSTGILTIRPGRKHIAKVWRAGKKVKKIQLFRIPKAEANVIQMYENGMRAAA